MRAVAAALLIAGCARQAAGPDDAPPSTSTPDGRAAIDARAAGPPDARVASPPDARVASPPDAPTAAPDASTVECQPDHAPCFAHAECCDGPCVGGYCDGPESPGCAIESVSCWSHGQCCSGLCNVQGLCIAPRPEPCIPDFSGCFFDTDCCSGSCYGPTDSCASSTPGTWLP